MVLIMILNIDLQADGDLVSAVDFSTQYLVTGHEVMRPSFFGFLSEFVSRNHQLILFCFEVENIQGTGINTNFTCTCV